MKAILKVALNSLFEDGAIHFPCSEGSKEQNEIGLILSLSECMVGPLGSCSMLGVKSTSQQCKQYLFCLTKLLKCPMY